MKARSQTLTLDLVISIRVEAFSWTSGDIAAKLGVDGEERLSQF